MPIPIHLVSVVGGAGVGILPHTLRHYQALGVTSFFVIVHVRQPDELFVERVRGLAATCGIALDGVVVDLDYHRAQRSVLGRIMAAHPDDWFLPIDCDELQRYPSGLAATLERCDRAGYDHLYGCFVDRVSADGSLNDVRRDVSLWDQFPLGGFITYPLLGGDPRKVVAAKGRVTLENGHHRAANGRGCPIGVQLIPVHHFKWVATLLPYLSERRALYKRLAKSWWVESDRCLAYFSSRDRIQIDDPRLLVSPCRPDYRHWNRVHHMVMAADEAMENRA